MKILKDDRGAVSLKALIWIIIIFSALYAAYKFVPPAVGFYMIKTEVEDETKIAHMYNDRELTGRIMKKAELWDVPLDRDNIEIDRRRSSISISVQYSVTLSFIGGYTMVKDYDIEVTRPLKETGSSMY
ncbi:MAG: hypothetical protein ACE5GY_04675 [Thermodesulfobacteriota bacterium]